MASASIFLSLPAACSVQGPYPPMYGVWVSCQRGSTHTALLNRVESKAFCLINSPPLTDYLDSLSHHCNVASLSLFYHYFHADCYSELANCMPPPPSRSLAAQGFLLVLIPILFTFQMQELTSIFTLSSLTLINSGILLLSVFPSTYDLNFQRSVKMLLMLNWTSIPYLYFYCSLYSDNDNDSDNDFINTISQFFSIENNGL